MRAGSNWVPYAIYAAVAVAVVVRGCVNVAVTRYHLLGRELRIDYGLLQKQSKRVRLNRVQSVDLLEPLAARIFGLAELKVTTAGTERVAVRLRYLALPVARALRADLLGRSAGADQAVAEAPERPVLSVPHGRLVRAVLLEMVSWRLVLLLVGPALGLLGQSNGHRPTIGLGVALSVSFTVVILHAIWRRVSTLWDFTISDSPDGLRIRHGLLSTSRQTVPPGRIQAILVHQPMSWRPFGWAQVRMNVAGYAGSANSKSTMLVPVTDRAYRPRPGRLGVGWDGHRRRTAVSPAGPGGTAGAVVVEGAVGRVGPAGVRGPPRAPLPHGGRRAPRTDAERPPECRAAAAGAEPCHRAPRLDPGAGQDPGQVP